MSKPKNKKPAAPVLMLISEEAMVGALNQYAEARLDMEHRQAEHDKTIAEYNTLFDTQVQALREKIASLETSLQLFCLQNKERLFVDPKSREYANATVGFALNPHKVEKLLSKDTEEAIANRLDAVPWGEAYVEWSAALNKQLLLRDKASFTPEQLAMAGIKFTQGERFFIEIKSTTAEKVSKPAVEAAA